MIDSMGIRLDMPKEHRRRAFHSHLVPGSMHFHPFGGALLAPADLLANPGIKNLRAAAGNRAESMRAEGGERVGNRGFENALRQVPDFDRGKSLDEERR